MMDDHEQLFEEAVDAVTRLFSDNSVDRQRTKEDLETLAGEIQVMLDTLEK